MAILFQEVNRQQLYPADAPPASHHGGVTAGLFFHVIEAVLAVVIIALPGYHLARRGIFTADLQKKLNELTLNYLTPCLIFSKIGGKLNGERFMDLWIMLPLFILISAVPIIVAKIISRFYGFKPRPASFVTAMAVFGNSNSLPISLIYSLAYTVNGLRWDRIPDDNQDDVIARGIIYLLILQQLGQILRWSWGVNQLLKGPTEWPDFEPAQDTIEGGYRDDPDQERSRRPSLGAVSEATLRGTPSYHPSPLIPSLESSPTPPNSHPTVGHGSLPDLVIPSDVDDDADHETLKPARTGWDLHRHRLTQTLRRGASAIKNGYNATTEAIHRQLSRIYAALPPWMQRTLDAFGRFGARLKEQINLPLLSLVVSLLVAVIEPLRLWFFTKGTLQHNAITMPVTQLGNTAVPLILIILGAQLDRKALGDEGLGSADSPKQERQLVIASLLARMVLSPLILTPMLAIIIKFMDVSILDDPILSVVVMLVVGSPPALQLSQICQRNGTYMKVLSRIFVWGYVVLILPNTFILVMAALLIRKWADM